MTRIVSSARFVVLTAALTAIGTLDAQTCAGTQDFSGPYVFTSVRLLYAAQSVTPPGTTAASSATAAPLIFTPQADAAPGTTDQYSLTPIGQLVGRASNATPFSNVGRVLADGAGVLYATRGNDPSFVRVGTYTVSSECMMSVTLNDAFSSDKVPVSFQGVLTDRGGEANLVQSSQGSGALVNFVRPLLASGCSSLSLSGRYGLSALGVDLSPEASPGVFSPNPVAPVTVALQFNADGGGLIGPPAGGAGYTGSYSVNSDCTGSLTLISPDKKLTRKMAFALTSGNAATGQVTRAAALLVLDETGKLAGIGEAR